MQVVTYIGVLTPIKMKKILLLAGVLFTLFTSCKKSKPADETPTPTTPTTGSALDLMRDSVFLYAKEDYYWNDGLPDYTTFNPRAISGSTDLAALQTEVNALSQYKINPLTSKPYEYYSPSPGQAKYSFIDDGTASGKLNAVTGDFGFAPFYDSKSGNVNLYVKYVYAGSPADLAGVKRGYQIVSINGRTALDGTVSANVSFVVSAYSASSTITMILKKPDATTFTVTLNASAYTIKPVITYKVLDYSATTGKKIGYIVFNSYVTLTSTQAALTTAFNSFTTAGITDLVVDLRYNGGGYVETAEFLDNLIAPTSATGKTMYTAYYNSTLTTNKEVLLKNQVRRDAITNQIYNYSQIDYSLTANTEKFAKQGSLNLSRVFFIVGQSTASASELTINNLRPYMNVQLIGTTTYGKPVGFFDININKYQMYIPEFETKNSLGQGGYYSGMTPASTDYPGKFANDDVTKDFGDVTEGLLSQTINYVNNGIYLTSSDLQVQSTESSSNKLTTDAIAQKLNGKEFNGMIFQHHKLKQ
jgi:carboxyl-terminal processing protease